MGKGAVAGKWIFQNKEALRKLVQALTSRKTLKQACYRRSNISAVVVLLLYPPAVQTHGTPVLSFNHATSNLLHNLPSLLNQF